MSGICLPIDADGSGVPAFPAAQQRVADAVFAYPVSGRALAGRGGIRPGATPVMSLTGSNWTLTPFAFEADTGSALAVGPYRGAFLANETGTINPADGTNPRIDRLDVQVPDEPPPLSGAARIATIVYTPGVPNAVPSAPAAPPRSFPLGTFNVPASGTGSPSWTAATQLTVAAGGILPVASVAAYGSGLYVGQVVDDAALGGLQRWTGTAWAPIPLGKWIDYTPKLTDLQNSATVIGSSIGYARYQVSGKTCRVKGSVSATAGTTAGHGVACDLPLPARERELVCGTAGIFLGTPPNQTGLAIISSDLGRVSALGSYLAGVTDIANGQVFRFSITYELP